MDGTERSGWSHHGRGSGDTHGPYAFALGRHGRGLSLNKLSASLCGRSVASRGPLPTSSTCPRKGFFRQNGCKGNPLPFFSGGMSSLCTRLLRLTRTFFRVSIVSAERIMEPKSVSGGQVTVSVPT